MRDDLFGAHVSAAGGVEKAPGRGAEIGCNTIQIFTANQRRWNTPQISDDTGKRFRKSLDEYNIKKAFAHGSYLINPASDDPALREKSRKALSLELERCTCLDLEGLVIHPGNSKGLSIEEGIMLAVSMMDDVMKMFESGTMLLLETTAGAGTQLGKTIEELAEMLTRSSFPERLGVCLDTCHMWAAGYDLRNDYEGVLNTVDTHMGIDKIKLFHFNDSKGELGSNLDRHDNIGAGRLGKKAFANIVRDERLKNIPMILETPGGPSAYKEDLAYLRRL